MWCDSFQDMTVLCRSLLRRLCGWEDSFAPTVTVALSVRPGCKATQSSVWVTGRWPAGSPRDTACSSGHRFTQHAGLAYKGRRRYHNSRMVHKSKKGQGLHQLGSFLFPVPMGQGSPPVMPTTQYFWAALTDPLVATLGSRSHDLQVVRKLSMEGWLVWVRVSKSKREKQSR